MKIKNLLGLFGAMAVVASAPLLSTTTKPEAPVMAESEATSENMLMFTPGSKLSTYAGYQRYEGYKLTLNGETVSNEQSAFVLKLHTISSRNCGLTFYLNNTLVSGESAKPTQTYLYSDNGYISAVSHGSFAVGYYSDTTAKYVVVPFSNFTNGSAASVKMTSFTIAIRLKGVTTTDKLYLGSLSAYLRDISVVSNYTAQGEIDFTNLHSIYKPSATNFAEFDSGNTGITKDCMEATFYDGAAVDYVKSFNQAIGGVCDSDGATNKNNLKTAWEDKTTEYNSLSTSAKAYLTLDSSKYDLDDSKEFAGKYSYVYGKYGATLALSNFIGRNVSSSQVVSYNSLSANNSTIVIVSTISALAILVTAAFLFRKKYSK